MEVDFQTPNFSLVALVKVSFNPRCSPYDLYLTCHIKGRLSFVLHFQSNVLALESPSINRSQIKKTHNEDIEKFVKLQSTSVMFIAW